MQFINVSVCVHVVYRGQMCLYLNPASETDFSLNILVYNQLRANPSTVLLIMVVLVVFEVLCCGNICSNTSVVTSKITNNN